MNNDVVIIEKFSLIDKIELKNSAFTLLIGPQASGKSLVAKLKYFMNECISSLFMKCLMNSAPIAEFEKAVVREFSSLFPSYLWINDKFSVSRKVDNRYSFCISRSRNKTKNLLNFKYSEEIKKIYVEIFTAVKSAKKEKKVLFFFGLDDFLKAMYPKPFEWMTKCYFVPAGRSFFSAIHDNLFALLSSNFDESDGSVTGSSLANIDPFMKIFGQNYERVKHIADSRSILKDEKLMKILKGMYVRKNGHDYIQQNDKMVKVENASSGQQEVLPMLMTMLYYAARNPSFPYSKNMFVIEEPEAHIFPESQKQIVDLIASLFNNNYGRTEFVITTHSPYVATSLNNVIMKSGRKGIKYTTSDFSAYAIQDGYIKSIIDKETNLIDSEIIDSVSNVIADEFDSLL